MLGVDDVAREIGIAVDEPLWHSWAQSQALAENNPTELMLDGVDRLRTIAGDSAMYDVLADHAKVIAANPWLRRLLWHCHWRVFCQAQETDALPAASWQPLPDRWGEAGCVFYALVLLSGISQLVEAHQRRGIPQTVTADTLSDLPLWLHHYRDRHGQWGLIKEMEWLVSHFTGRLYRLGRLQFRFERFGHDFCGWRNRTNGNLCLLAGDGLKFRSDGQFQGADGMHDEAGTWQARYRHSDTGRVEGHPILCTGKVQRDPVMLDEREWDVCLHHDDAVLGIHIPATGPMTNQVCRASLCEAKHFFAEHFPAYRFSAFTCESWLLDYQLTHYLPAETNIVRFGQMFHRYPIPGADAQQTYERVFGSSHANPLTSPLRTSLQRAVADHVRAGGQWRITGGLILPSALD